MLAFPAAIRIFLAVRPVDMRRSFNGLWAAVSEQLGEDPKGGAVFCFTNADRTRLKLLYWDGTGVWVLAKRLERGRFSWAAATDERAKRRSQLNASTAAPRIDPRTSAADEEARLRRAIDRMADQQRRAERLLRR